MYTIQKDEMLKQLKIMIAGNIPGTAEVMAQKITVSRRTVFRLINHLRVREQQDIKFCKKRNCYFLKNNH